VEQIFKHGQEPGAELIARCCIAWQPGAAPHRLAKQRFGRLNHVEQSDDELRFLARRRGHSQITRRMFSVMLKHIDEAGQHAQPSRRMPDGLRPRSRMGNGSWSRVPDTTSKGDQPKALIEALYRFLDEIGAANGHPGTGPATRSRWNLPLRHA
jgi:hypothetical protein